MHRLLGSGLTVTGNQDSGLKGLAGIESSMVVGVHIVFSALTVSPSRSTVQRQRETSPCDSSNSRRMPYCGKFSGCPKSESKQPPR